ncbi:MAG: 1-deoxy-D-xylulose-5-phosphate synthase, partial [Verrucomicrobia bacterium]|nr:1-deoxy-D-xylulose-5-phosphate synthase [Verrucomicrobiota bacterium]
LNSMAKEAAGKLVENNYDVAVINPRFTKPIDEATTLFYGQAADLVITMEDHNLPGGYGSSVMELFGDKQVTTPVLRIGWPDQFIEHATSVSDLRNKYGLTANDTVKKAMDICPATSDLKKSEAVAK